MDKDPLSRRASLILKRNPNYHSLPVQDQLTPNFGQKQAVSKTKSASNDVYTRIEENTENPIEKNTINTLPQKLSIIKE